LYSAAALTQTAAAQNAPATSSSDQLQEVVVTAQFRSESVQQTPLAITAINAAMLEQRIHRYDEEPRQRTDDHQEAVPDTHLSS